MANRRSVILGFGVLLICGIIIYLFCLRDANYPNAGPVVFPEYEEKPEWEEVETDRFTIRLPRDWRISEGLTDSKRSGEVLYEINDPEGKSVISITTENKADHFIQCMCAEKSHYTFSQLNGNNLWYLELWTMIDREPGESPVLQGITFKAGGDHFSVDIHCTLSKSKSEDSKLLIHLIQSLRAK